MGWFTEWFGTEYYSLLYKHRDHKEAQEFLDNLIAYLPISPGGTILDVGCGNGRHSIYLAEKGFNVTGLDVVEKNIREAKQHEREKLHFLQHDMREPFPVKGFDLALNLFTSFGYFDKTEEEVAALKNIHHALKPEGLLVIDFLNAEKVADEIIPHEKIEREGIVFDITRSIENKHVIKNINVDDKGRRKQYTEVVELLELCDFDRLFDETGFRIRSTFGNYRLSPFDPESSERLIMLVEKI